MSYGGEASESSDDLSGHELVGREILVYWEQDGVWYDAVVVRFFPQEDEYKLVYRIDDGIEVTRLGQRRWILIPKKEANPNRPILDGAIIEFTYPKDGKRYQAMIYNQTHGGARLKVAYLEEHSTDNIQGGGWDFLTGSPCLDESKPPRVAARRRPLTEPRGACTVSENGKPALPASKRNRAIARTRSSSRLTRARMKEDLG